MKTMNIKDCKKQILSNLSANTIHSYIHSKVEDWVSDEIYDGILALSEDERDDMIDDCTQHIMSKIKIDKI